MIESAVAFTLFDKVLSGLGLLREGKKERTAKTDQALMALYAALSETKKYISEENMGAVKNREMEWKIAELWHKASIPLREIDPELAEKCFLKGSYWLEPEAWTQERITQTDIAIDTVFEATRALLLK
jgi:hypothetical protein